MSYYGKIWWDHSFIFNFFALVSESKADFSEKTQEYHATKSQSKWKNRYQVLPCKYENATEFFSFPLLVFFLCLVTLCLGVQGVSRQAHTEAGEAALFQSWTFVLLWGYSTCWPNRKWLLPTLTFFLLLFGWVELTHGAISKCRAPNQGYCKVKVRNTTFTFGISELACTDITFLCSLLQFELDVWYSWRGTASFCADKLQSVHLMTDSLF